jgi:hypothetical protein
VAGRGEALAGLAARPGWKSSAERPDPAGKLAERARHKHELVRALRAEGPDLREIARHLGRGLHAVQRYDRAATWQEPAESRWPPQRPGKLDPFKPCLDQHAGGGHGSFTRLFPEVTARVDWRKKRAGASLLMAEEERLMPTWESRLRADAGSTSRTLASTRR